MITQVSTPTDTAIESVTLEAAGAFTDPDGFAWEAGDGGTA